MMVSRVIRLFEYIVFEYMMVTREVTEFHLSGRKLLDYSGEGERNATEGNLIGIVEGSVQQ